MPVGDQVVLAARACGRLAKVRCEPPFEGPDMRGVDGRVVHLQQARGPQLSQQYLVQLRPDTGLGPVPQTPPGRHPSAANLFSRNVPPAHALAQHVNDAPQRSPVIRRQPPGIPMPPRRTSRQQRATRSHRSSGTRSADTQQILPTPHPTAKHHNESHSETISKALLSPWLNCWNDQAESPEEATPQRVAGTPSCADATQADQWCPGRGLWRAGTAKSRLRAVRPHTRLIRPCGLPAAAASRLLARRAAKRDRLLLSSEAHYVNQQADRGSPALRRRRRAAADAI